MIDSGEKSRSLGSVAYIGSHLWSMWANSDVIAILVMPITGVMDHSGYPWLGAALRGAAAPQAATLAVSGGARAACARTCHVRGHGAAEDDACREGINCNSGWDIYLH